jgi:hypothetical protein
MSPWTRRLSARTSAYFAQSFSFVGKRIDHPRPLAVPFRVLVAVEDVVGHVAGADDRAGHDAADLLARPGKAQHRARQDALPRGALRKRPRRLVRLRVVQDHERRATVFPSARLYFMPRMRPVIPATLMIAPDALLPGMVGKTTSFAVQPMCVRSPLYSWPAAAVGDAVEAPDGMDHLREVGLQEVVAVEFHLDGVEHLDGVDLRTRR